MDAENIPRRERRHYRIYKDGKIIYSQVPVDKSLKKESINNYTSTDSEDTKFKKSLLNIDEKKNIEDVDKDKIKKVLQTLSDIIAPDVDAVSEAIYNQIKNDDYYDEFNKKDIQKTIKSSKHYRASKNEDSSENEVIDSDNIKSLVEDVFLQLQNENIKTNSEKKKEKIEPKKEKKSVKTIKKEEDSVSKKSKKEDLDFKDLLDEDDSEDSSEDDLGLKF